MSERNLVRIVTIDDVKPIENSDFLDVATVGGWKVVVSRGLYEPNDVAWYCEVDSLLPVDLPQFQHLEERGVKEFEGRLYHRLKTIKLRGQVSQGLLVPGGEMGLIPLDAGDSKVAEYLGVLKYDEAFPPVEDLDRAGRVGSFLTRFAPKTDAERVQNLSKIWDDIVREDWDPVLKVDGSSVTICRDEEGQIRICSRNQEVKEGGNVYWRTALQYTELLNALPDCWAIQAEVYGPGVQNNRTGVQKLTLGIFNVLSYGTYLPRSKWMPEALELALPIYEDIPFPDTIEEAIAQTNGLKSIINPAKLAEGIVWTHRHAKVPAVLDRNCFKSINNEYLIRFGG